ncbi:hypothetical protein MKZ26_18545 [Sporosarcina sp. FSL K6-6792]|uniref:hypothetical protein n=1 Tax=Sporosarcina sp. FSL K6-6792 TaxID=2921559 RepID=UPI0030F7722C
MKNSFLSLKSIHHQHGALLVRHCPLVRTAVTAVMLMTYRFQIDMFIFKFYSISGFATCLIVQWSFLLNAYLGYSLIKERPIDWSRSSKK